MGISINFTSIKCGDGARPSADERINQAVDAIGNIGFFGRETAGGDPWNETREEIEDMLIDLGLAKRAECP